MARGSPKHDEPGAHDRGRADADRPVPDDGGARHRRVGLLAAIVMVGAAWSHSKLHEPQNVAADGLLFAAAMAVAIGRLAAL